MGNTMTKDQFTLGESSTIRVESCSGDLIIRGWTKPLLQVRGDYQIEETEKGFKLESRGDLHLMLPRDTTVTVGRVSRDMVIKLFTGAVTAEYVHGDAVLSQAGDFAMGIVHGDLVARNLLGAISADEVNGDVVARVVGGASFGAIHGDLSARVVDGDLHIDAIHGDADLRTINGNVTVNQGFRDINLHNIGGLLSIAGVTGDVRLRGGLSDGDHQLNARGDIVVRWPAGMAVNIHAEAPIIDNRLQMDELTEKPGTLSGHVGAGKVNLTMTTAGKIILRDAEPVNEKWNSYGGEMEFDFGMDMDGMASRIQAEVDNHLSRVTRELEAKFGAGFAQQINDKVNRKVERASERARRRTDVREKSPSFESAAAATPRKPVVTEEHLRILKMVETGKISPEEAGMLLDALEV